MTWSADQITARISESPYWYHRIALPNGVVTPGWAPVNAETYGIPESLKGKRVLDVGAWDGYWTFEALRRGAEQVVAIDDFSDFLGALDTKDRQAWRNFDTCKEILGFNDQQCQRIDMSVYDLRPEQLGTFDVIFFFGTLYHLRHPLLALDRLSAICSGELYVESAILDDFSPYRGGLGHGYAGNQLVMEFYPGRQYGNNETNWWVPTLTCLGYMVRAAGFRSAQGWKLAESPDTLAYCRGFVHASK